MQPLIERLPPGAPQLERFDARLGEVDHRRSVKTKYKPETEKAHQRRYRRYVEWCAEAGYQSDPQFITTDKIREFTEWMVKVKRYAPFTILQAFRALEIYAERAGVDVSRLPSRGLFGDWVEQLRELGEIPENDYSKPQGERLTS